MATSQRAHVTVGASLAGLRSSHPDVYAAGDVARTWHPLHSSDPLEDLAAEAVGA